VSLAQGRSLQVYADPERVGFSQLHATYFTAEGEEEAVDDVVIIATDPAGVSHELEPRPFSPGHFIADVDLTEGTWRFELEAATGSGEVLVVTVEIEVPG
jgi:nitrogen fixation protein FixH